MTTNQCDDYRCDEGWLPTDGIADTITDRDGQPLPLLFPTTYTPCPCCNPLAAMNEDLCVTALDVWRTERVTIQ